MLLTRSCQGNFGLEAHEQADRRVFVARFPTAAHYITCEGLLDRKAQAGPVYIFQDVFSYRMCPEQTSFLSGSQRNKNPSKFVCSCGRCVLQERALHAVINLEGSIRRDVGLDRVGTVGASYVSTSGWSKNRNLDACVGRSNGVEWGRGARGRHSFFCRSVSVWVAAHYMDHGGEARCGAMDCGGTLMARVSIERGRWYPHELLSVVCCKRARMASCDLR